jgi:hypothetical protein
LLLVSCGFVDDFLLPVKNDPRNHTKKRTNC